MSSYAIPSWRSCYGSHSPFRAAPHPSVVACNTNCGLWAMGQACSSSSGSGSPMPAHHAIIPILWRRRQKTTGYASTEDPRLMSVLASGLYFQWLTRPLILAVAVLLMVFTGTGFLGLQYWHERQAADHSLQHSRQSLDTLDRLRTIIADLEAERRGYLMTLGPASLTAYGGSDPSARREAPALQAHLADDPFPSLPPRHLPLTLSS